jgi:4-hydroxythreonine-4-phosphate dehydrogenase
METQEIEKMVLTPKIPKLVITMGDPSSIGPEVILKALGQMTTEGLVGTAEITLCGDRIIFQDTYQQLCRSARDVADSDIADPEMYPLLEVPIDRMGLEIGVGNAASGDGGFWALAAAIEATNKGEFDAIVTAPIAKSAWKMAGHLYPGQTEVLAQMSGCDRFGMAFVGRSPQSGWILRTLLATTHIPLNQVPIALAPALMTQKLELLIEHLKNDFQLKTPTIAIAGLNPHSGELGQLGMEEMNWINGWLEEMRSRFPDVTLIGLLPPDTMWVKPGQAWFHGKIEGVADAFLALYHDQGLIPVKLMAFDRAVNTTIGLPFVRTSPDHGTAFDIAGRGLADGTSMAEAIGWAVELVRSRWG